jgi:hypothetical protein
MLPGGLGIKELLLVVGIVVLTVVGLAGTVAFSLLSRRSGRRKSDPMLTRQSHYPGNDRETSE